MYLTKINRNGQISLPAALRKQLSLKVGDWVQVDEKGLGQMILTPVHVSKKQIIPEAFVKKCEADGVDLGLLMSSLKRTPTERAQVNRFLLEFKEEARKAREARA